MTTHDITVRLSEDLSPVGAYVLNRLDGRWNDPDATEVRELVLTGLDAEALVALRDAIDAALAA